MAKSNPEKDCKIDTFCLTCGQSLLAGGKVKMTEKFKNIYSALLITMILKQIGHQNIHAIHVTPNFQSGKKRK